jgi:alpha,alpha-trehalase
MARLRRLSIFAAATLIALLAQAPVAKRVDILDYIRQTWRTLTRSNSDLAKAAVDPKFHALPDGRWPVYVPGDENVGAIETRLRHEMSGADYRKIALLSLPENADALGGRQGLLYLPHAYVVPGGRFNEMYGWDSYFIQVGLLRDGDIDLARDMADNFTYEIREYGKILNANRTYYLTRSQPPFLTEMLLGVYKKTKDRKWLENAVPEIETYYRYWTAAPHLTVETGLSRYWDSGEGPAPEVVSGERDAQGRDHYERVKQYFRTHKITAYDVSEYYDARRNVLTPLFYKGDRSMRESGFDPSDLFGPFNIDVIHYNPVGLNSLLYRMETQTAEILKILGRDRDAGVWQQRAGARAARINRLMWDSKDGLYYNYDFAENRVRRYPFLTTFYPLWAGIATPEQAARVAANLPRFERAGGLETSTFASGNQWDAPFGWAPLEMIAVDGLRRYGYHRDADRIAGKFLSMVREQYQKHGIIVEKYDVVRRAIQVSKEIKFGYSSNEAGFGWTNAVYTHLLDELPAAERQ